jgi:hypothetical protein
MSAFRVLAVEDVPARPDADGREWLPLRDALGVGAFGVNAWRAAHAGAEVIERHDEDDDQRHEELYLVLRGTVRFEVAGETIDAPAGTALLVSDPAAERRGVAHEAGALVLTVGAPVGRAFAVSDWERRELAR